MPDININNFSNYSMKIDDSNIKFEKPKNFGMSNERFISSMEAKTEQEFLHMGYWDKFKDLFRDEKKSESLKVMFEIVNQNNEFTEGTKLDKYIALKSCLKNNTKEEFYVNYEKEKNLFSIKHGVSILSYVHIQDAVKSLTKNLEPEIKSNNSYDSYQISDKHLLEKNYKGDTENAKIDLHNWVKDNKNWISANNEKILAMIELSTNMNDKINTGKDKNILENIKFIQEELNIKKEFAYSKFDAFNNYLDYLVDEKMKKEEGEIGGNNYLYKKNFKTEKISEKQIEFNTAAAILRDRFYKQVHAEPETIYKNPNEYEFRGVDNHQKNPNLINDKNPNLYYKDNFLNDDKISEKGSNSRKTIDLSKTE